MTDHLRRQSRFRGFLVTFLARVGLRPASPAPPACPHPVHQPLCAERPGAGTWYRTLLRLVCPRCGHEVQHEGYMPGWCLAYSDTVRPPDHAHQLPTDSFNLSSYLSGT